MFTISQVQCVSKGLLSFRKLQATWPALAGLFVLALQHSLGCKAADAALVPA